ATKGKAYVVYDDILDAVKACSELNGVQIAGRFLRVSYHHEERLERAERELALQEQRLQDVTERVVIQNILDETE
ncbi:hypothetical protein KIPB_008570, partial [Kipferlia bialata]